MGNQQTIRPAMTRSQERDLIARSKRDPEAFGRIYDEYFPGIFRYILYRVADAALSEDLAAQTFYKALKYLGRFRWTGISISAWLYRIAANEVNSHFRRSGRATFTDIEKISERLPDEDSRPDRELEIAERNVAENARFVLLNRCIQHLKQDEQTLLTLRYLNRKRFAEIAEILGVKEGTLRMRNKRALEKLKIQLQKQGIDDESIGRSPIQYTQTGSEGHEFSAEAAPESA